jgi:hypothetical protein
MMVLSRLWYVVLALLLGMATYVVYLAVGQYDRRNAVAMEEELASDSQTVGWALSIDARKRLDALLIGAVDKGLQDSLQAASGKDAIPTKSRNDGAAALRSIVAKIPADFRPDAIFEVDHDGRVISQVGFDAASAFADFELGGYPAVFDALHGYLRDDTWVLGGKAYRVAARPVEVDSTQPPLGAIVALKAVDSTFAQEISKRTRANVAFFAGGLRVATATVNGFDATKLTAVDSDLAAVLTEKSYEEGRSDSRAPAPGLGAIYTRFVGDAWMQGAGFVVVRSQTTIGGPLGFLNGADDKDKQSVNIALIAAVVILGLGIGIGLSVLEQSLPLGQMVKQAASLRKGELDYLQVARFRGAYRGIADNINAGIERVLERGGGAVRKPADLESILGPVPAQPAMSAFSFPLADAGKAPPAAFPVVPPATPAAAPAAAPPLHPPPSPAQSGATAALPGVAAAGFPRPKPAGPPPPVHTPALSSPFGIDPTVASPTRGSAPAFPIAGPPIPPPVGARPQNFQIGSDAVDGDGPTMASAASPAGRNPIAPFAGPQEPLVPPRPKGPSEAGGKLGMGAPAVPAAGRRPEAPVAKSTMMGMGLEAQAALGNANRGAPFDPDAEEESTVIAKAPSELLAAATGPGKVISDETAEWMGVYDEFLRVKKQCNEPTDGLSFDKFQNTLRKNRDALVERHGCKRVRFSVYVKDGRASLKATPVKE